jgi:hypothetical protein
MMHLWSQVFISTANMSDFEREEMPNLSNEIIHLARLSGLSFNAGNMPQELIDDRKAIKMLNLDNSYDIYLKYNVVFFE